jgi:hypothetical protein
MLQIRNVVTGSTITIYHMMTWPVDLFMVTATVRTQRRCGCILYVCVVCLSYFNHIEDADEAVGYYILLAAAARLQCLEIGRSKSYVSITGIIPFMVPGADTGHSLNDPGSCLCFSNGLGD